MPSQPLVCGTAREPLEFKPVSAGVLLTPDDFDIPHRRCFTPSELAPYFKADARTITRMIEEGIMRAIDLGHGRYKIPYIEIVHFFMRQQGAMN
jgi:excisionase family DNA binding protein